MVFGIQIRGFGSKNHGIPPAYLITIIVFMSLALYNVIELLVIIQSTFKKKTGSYFWSFLVATLGIASNVSGFFIKFFGPTSLGYLSCTLSLMGWVTMITGQSMVLWSRLHLVMRHKRRLRVILWIIIIDAICFHGMIIPMVYGSFSSNPRRYERPYYVAEKIELIGFFLQEVMLSSLYIIEAVSLIRSESIFGNKGPATRLMKHLIFVNALVIILDITVLALEFANLYDVQIVYKPWAYSVKLKLEFTVLNSLVNLATASRQMAELRSTSGGTVTRRTSTC